MLPELDVFHAHGEEFIHPEWVALHNKDLGFVTPAGQRGLKTNVLVIALIASSSVNIPTLSNTQTQIQYTVIQIELLLAFLCGLLVNYKLMVL